MKDLLSNKSRIHFIGIAGIGMSGLAKALKAFGFFVSGSDIREGKIIQDLRKKGILVSIGHDPANLQGADLVVYSSAISRDNPEFIYAQNNAIPLAHRAELLAYFMNQEKSIAILGTHGKTTTSSLVSHLLTKLDFHPTCFVGGEMINFGDNVLLGERNWMVGEVDESDGTHLLFSPSHVILTNLEEDHLDHYKGLEDIKANFKKFLDNLRKESLIVYSVDCPNLRDVLAGVLLRKISYGFSKSAEFSAVDVKLSGLSSTYRLVHLGQALARVELNIPGLHNVINSLGAIALLTSMGVPTEMILKYLPEFRGAARRLQVKFNEPGLLVVDDYAHHPTEVQATLAALKACGRKLTCVFQPHRYSRAFSLAKAFGSAFDFADRLILTEIYGAGETNVGGIDSSIIESAVVNSGHPRILRMPKEKVIDYLRTNPIPNEIVAFLGAGDITEVADRFVETVRAQDCNLERVG